MNFKAWLENKDDYRGLHKAPSKNHGSPLHDLTNTYPNDIYGPMAARYYGHGDPTIDNFTISVIQSSHNKPDQPIKIYRAVPNSIDEKKINYGDWVTINKKYAIQHGESSLNGEYIILTKTVPAKTLYTDGNSIHEWGYNS